MKFSLVFQVILWYNVLTNTEKERVITLASIEPQVADHFNQIMRNLNIDYKLEQMKIDPMIDTALVAGESKRGGNGGNRPDAKILYHLEDADGTPVKVPVVIEYKGTKGRLVKLDANGFVDNYSKTKNVNRRVIGEYAVNGAVHYARAILDGCLDIDYVYAVGANGYETARGTQYEVAIYLVTKDNFGYELLLYKGDNLELLRPETIQFQFLSDCEKMLTKEQYDVIHHEKELELETALTGLNELLHNLGVSVSSRVEFVSGMIMASLEYEGVGGLRVEELKSGRRGTSRFDGKIMVDKIRDFLQAHELPEDKVEFILNRFERIFIHSKLSEPQDDGGWSITKQAYQYVKDNIYDYYSRDLRLDFTGKLFQVMNAWVAVPDAADNDVVLTPRMVTELLVSLTKVNYQSKVWDFALGSGGFLVAALKAMFNDPNYQSLTIEEKLEARRSILTDQLLGIEKLDSMYMLSILNMILMGDGSANILRDDSLTFDGNYVFGEHSGKPFNADVFLLNPPYSAEGKGLIFAQHALSMMDKGYAAVLIQENAGSGQGNPYAKELLKKNTLLGSIKMADIFKGKASVQTAVYLFRVGRAHEENDIVRFLDMSEDGYIRQNRKKSSADVNLKDDGTARARYDEVARLMDPEGPGGYIGGKYTGEYYDETKYVEDTITLNGDDWTFAKHQVIDTIPKEEDFLDTIGKFLEFQVSQVIQGRIDLDGLDGDGLKPKPLTEYNEEEIEYGEFRLGELFEVFKMKGVNQDVLKDGNDFLYITRTSLNNGIHSRTGKLGTSIRCADAGTYSLGLLNMDFFLQDEPWYAGQFVREIRPSAEYSRKIMIYFLVILQKHREYFSRYLVREFDVKFSDKVIFLPIDVHGNIHWSYMKSLIHHYELQYVSQIQQYTEQELRITARVLGVDFEEFVRNDEPIELPDLEQVEVGEFKLKDLFEVSRGTRLKKVDRVPGKFPLITAGGQNQGLSEYIKENKELFSKNTLTIDMFGNCFFRSYEFFADDNILVLKNENLSKDALLYITGALKYLTKKYNYTKQYRLGSFNETVVLLPITKDGTPDWNFMETYVRIGGGLFFRRIWRWLEREYSSSNVLSICKAI